MPDKKNPLIGAFRAPVPGAPPDKPAEEKKPVEPPKAAPDPKACLLYTSCLRVVDVSAVAQGVLFAEGSCHRAGGAPVSYTHLDVYKRQLALSPSRSFTSRRRFPAISFIRLLVSMGITPFQKVVGRLSPPRIKCRNSSQFETNFSGRRRAAPGAYGNMPWAGQRASRRRSLPGWDRCV